MLARDVSIPTHVIQNLMTQKCTIAEVSSPLFHSILEVEKANGRNCVIEVGYQRINTSIQIEEKVARFQQNGSFEIVWK